MLRAKASIACLMMIALVPVVGTAQTEAPAPQPPVAPEVESPTEAPPPEEPPEAEEPETPWEETEEQVAPALAPSPSVQPELHLPPLPDPQQVSLEVEGPMEPRLWHVRLSGSVTELFVRSETLDPLKDDDLVVLGALSLGGEWAFLDGALPLSVHVGYATGSFGDRLFSTVDTDLDLHALQVGAQIGYRLWDALTPYVRGGLMTTWGRVTVSGVQDKLQQWAFAPGGYVLAGFELTVPRRWMRAAFRTEVFTVGLRFEAGYLFAGELEYDGEADSEGLLEEEQLALGTLEMGGAAVNVGLLLSF